MIFRRISGGMSGLGLDVTSISAPSVTADRLASRKFTDSLTSLCACVKSGCLCGRFCAWCIAVGLSTVILWYYTFIHHFRIRGDIPNFSCTHRLGISCRSSSQDSIPNKTGWWKTEKEGPNWEWAQGRWIFTIKAFWVEHFALIFLWGGLAYVSASA